ncbi:dTDP-4-dehydrorhamnose reductase [Myxococcota bacterium]|nr:dTDP-4-dehydrorhamnose reductase [Myxococcota bacterium]
MSAPPEDARGRGARTAPLWVTGAAGLVGSTLLHRARVAGRPVVGTGRADVDIADADAVRRAMERLEPAAVVNCAAQARVDDAERDPEGARLANAIGPEHLGRACAAAGIPLVHLSTDYVFGGDRLRRRPFAEDDPVAPLGAYGRSKVEGEERVREAAPRHHLIVRTQWVVGMGGRHDLVGRLVAQAREGRELSLADDQTGVTTCASELADALLALVAAGARGTLHVSGRGACTPREWIELAVRSAGLVPRVRVVSTAELGRPAPRPTYSVLDSGRAGREYGVVLSPWEVAVARVGAAHAPRVNSPAGG